MTSKVRFLILLTAAVLVIVSLISFGIYISIRDQYLDTFVATKGITSLEEVSDYLLSALPQDATTYQDTMDLLKTESTNCITVSPDSRNLDNLFPELSYDTGLICYVPLPADRFETVGVAEFIFLQPTLRVFLIFLEDILQDYSVDIVRTGL